MEDIRIPHDALVLVGDGKKVLFLRNEGSPMSINLVVENVLEQSNPPSREQGTDKPGRKPNPDRTARPGTEETDWHQLAEDRFAAEIADALYRRAHANRFAQLIVIAPPKILGVLRKSFHKEVSDRIVAEVPKDLTSHPVEDMERLLAA
jgi:protein required for attachment to host cells